MVKWSGVCSQCNQYNNCVSVFRDDGTFIRTIGQGALNCPWNVLVHRSDLVYVADSHHHRIAVFLPDGELTRTFGLQGRRKRQFVYMYSCGMAVSPDGDHLHISDCYNHRVQVFTLEGEYVRKFGTDQLKYPHWYHCHFRWQCPGDR